MARLLDLFCAEGGAAEGYLRAGFEEVVGVDNNEDFWYRYRGGRNNFIHDDALAYLLRHGDEFDAIHASPPCQYYSVGTTNGTRENHPDLILPTRLALEMTGKPWVIENVEGARSEMIDPLMLCGSMFDLYAKDEDGEMLRMERHRLFESNWEINPPSVGCFHPRLIRCAGAYGGGSSTKDPREGRGGYVPKLAVLKDLMDIDWMTRRGINQAIPPAYTEFIGRQLLEQVK